MGDNKLRGILLFSLCLVFFATADTIAKHLAIFIAVPFIVWARYLLQLLFMLFCVVPQRGRHLFLTQRPGLMALRGITQFATTMLNFLAFKTLPLAETTALIFAAPLLVALLAGPLLGEKVNLRIWLATIIGFCGVLLIVRPGGAMVGVGVIYALCSALCYAIYQLLTRKLSASEPPMRQLFYLALIGTAASSLIVPFYWPQVLPSFVHGGMICGLVICSYVGHSLMIRAFHQTPASRLAPLQYTQLIWATLFGLFFFAHFQDFFAILGILVIGFSGLILTLHRPRFVQRWQTRGDKNAKKPYP